LQQELIDKAGAKKMDFVPPPNDGIYDRYSWFVLRSAEGSQARRRQARSSRGGCSAQVAGFARNHSESDGRGAPSLDKFSKAWHDFEEKGRSRLDHQRHGRMGVITNAADYVRS
jgi:hypothetical protein